MPDLTGKKALVTGAGIGIGRDIAFSLARAGADLALTSFTHDLVDVVEQVRGYGRRAEFTRLDVTEPAIVESVMDGFAEALGGIDILVNNAGGLVERVAVPEMKVEHWNHVVELNLSSAFYCIRAVLPHMSRGGRIINISSLAGRDGGGQGSVAYAAAKAGMNGLTAGLAKELGPQGITVNSVAPGFIAQTPFHDTFTAPDRQQATISQIPLGRAGTPADVASLVSYLASDEAGFVTGAVIDVNGGVRPT